MKLDKYIERLNDYREKYGNVDVLVYFRETDYGSDLTYHYKVDQSLSEPNLWMERNKESIRFMSTQLVDGNVLVISCDECPYT